jgi:hypothetical protein
MSLAFVGNTNAPEKNTFHESVILHEYHVRSVGVNILQGYIIPTHECRVQCCHHDVVERVRHPLQILMQHIVKRDK